MSKSAINKKPALYNDINLIIQVLLEGVQNILDSHFIGMYIHGSLASGDFNPENNDIDFLVVIDDELSKKAVAPLDKMHKSIANSNQKGASKSEGSYVQKILLRNTQPPKTPRPYIKRGKPRIIYYGNGWILEQYTIREKGIRFDKFEEKNCC